MIKRILSLGLLILLCFLYACGANNAKAVYHTILPEDAKKMMDENSSYIILDVRTKAEYKEQHIPDAILIPNTEIKDRAETELPDKDALIFVYCRSGVRAAGAAKDLADMGYTSIYDIGGIINWPYDKVSG
ncbi:MAG: rhodanese-like domain-containing protein [Oscillospiraceae bacterium]|nr:rhodanese-like domain-containing protein [Oscillospiraceae bacterium]